MGRTPQQWLLGYAGLLVGLGFTLAIGDGFADGVRIVGGNIAVLCAIAAVVITIGRRLRRPGVQRAGVWLGVAVCLVGGLNFLRLAIKWQRGEFTFVADAAAAGAMGLAGLAVLVLLWRHVMHGSAGGWMMHVRRIGLAGGVLAVSAGLLMIKAATLPQSATAMLETVVPQDDLLKRLADSQVAQRLMTTALQDEHVQQTLVDNGLSPQQVELLTREPELRDAAIDLFIAQRDPSRQEAALRRSAAALETVFQHAADQPNAATIDAALQDAAGAMNLKPAELPAWLADADIETLAREFQLSSAAAPTINSSIDRADVLSQLAASQQALAPSVAPADQTRTRQPSNLLPAERITAEPAEARLPAERYAIVPLRLPGMDDSAAQMQPAQQNAPPNPMQINADALHFGLLDAASAPVSGLPGRPQPDTAVQSTQPSATAGAPEAHDVAGSRHVTTLQTSDLVAVADAVQANLQQHAARPAARVTDETDWVHSAGASLTSTGLVVLVIGAAVMLCCVAIGRNGSRPAPTAASPAT